MNRRNIGGVEFEAVKVPSRSGKPYWAARVVATDFLCSPGCFDGHSRPALWASIEQTAKLRGDRWRNDNLKS